VDMPVSRPISDKFPWSLETVAEFIGMIRHPDVKAVAVVLFQSGLSVSDLLNLTYGDIKREFEAGIEPICFDLARVKTDVPYMTFGGSWSCLLLRNYLHKRGRLRLEDPLFDISHRTIDLWFAKTSKRWLGDYRGQNPARPHSLRSAFRTILGDHKVDRTYIEFWMGHKLPEQEATYISKSRDGWRETYKTYAEPWLTPKNWRDI